jgi:hypothetical protein
MGFVNLRPFRRHRIGSAKEGKNRFKRVISKKNKKSA